MEAALARFGLSEADLLGEGVESRVFALGGSRVLRVLRSPKREEAEGRAAFLGLVGGGRYPYAVPRVLESGEAGGHPYSIEPRMEGRTLRSLLRGLSGARRGLALTAFLEAVDPLATADVSGLPFGELLGAERVADESWAGFLGRKASLVLADRRAMLEARVPRFDRALGRFHEGLSELEGFSGKALVHGDFYPAHVMVDEDLRVTGLLDFSGLTVVGDPHLDRAEALSSFEDPAREGAGEADADLIRGLLRERFGEGVLFRLRTYQLYYALLFSDNEPFNPMIFHWCLRTLERAAR